MRKINIPNGYLLAFFLDDAKILNLIFSQPIIFTFAAHNKILIFCKFWQIQLTCDVISIENSENFETGTKVMERSYKSFRKTWELL